MTASLQLLVVAALAASVAGCEVQERSFGDQGVGGAGGAGGSIGSSGGEGAQNPAPGGSCSVPSDCPAPSEPCQIPACVDGRCGAAPLPEDTEIEPEDGDCQRTVCDGDGARVVVPVDEVPDDGNPCTVDECVGTTPRHSPQPGSSCPGGECDETGRCVSSGPVRCVDDLDCGLPTDCQHSLCIAGDCVEEPAESGTPCSAGLSVCDGAGQCIGAECTDHSDCTDCGWSDFCVCYEGVCHPFES
ncbi:hypothetical protein [Sorangium sp. So ce1335]|uniref:hypothetical protein n=1 Tax=Sorangium sp. So ce1335 TaxID=3133335 RepID=UPI003F5ECA4F